MIAAGVLCGCLALVVLGPLLAIPAAFVPGSEFLDLGDKLFFLPQYVFPYGLTYSPAGSAAFPARTLGSKFDVLQWALIVISFGLIARNLRGLRLLAASVSTVIIVTVSVHWLLRVSGMEFMLDGP